jgi:predicted transport protein
MPLFQIDSESLGTVEQTNFATEKTLQGLIEKNLKVVFNCRLVESEFSTGAEHAGRIDTLALSEDDNPVIIEYKKTQSSELITQSLYYLHWIHDHRGDFELAAKRVLGNKVEVDWSGVRVICIAPNFTKYDLHAVQVMGADIEIWQYRLFKNSSLYLEEIFGRALLSDSEGRTASKNPVMVEAGKKAALTRATGVYTFEQHVAGKPKSVRDLAVAIQEYILGLDPSVQEVPKKLYVAYKISQNIATMTVLKQSVVVYLKLNPEEIKNPPSIGRDVRKIGHWGTGDFELEIKSASDLEAAKPLTEQAYRKVGS